MRIEEIKDIVYSIFSQAGYSIKNFNIQFPHPLDIKITKDKNENISLDFTKSMPKVSWKKLINLSAWVQGISLGENSGVLKLKYFPDIKFAYNDTSEMLFGSAYDFSDIDAELDQEYGDEDRKKIAKTCLHYAQEWATISSLSNEDFTSSSPANQNKLKKDCKNFITSNIKNEKNFGSPLLALLFFYVLLPAVLRVVVEKLFRKLFN